MWQKPVQDQRQTHTDREQQTEKAQEGVARAVERRLQPNVPLRRGWLLQQPRIRAISQSSSEHIRHTLEAKRVAAQEGRIACERARGIVQIHAATRELWVLSRVVGEAVVSPMEAPQPHGAPECQEPKDL